MKDPHAKRARDGAPKSDASPPLRSKAAEAPRDLKISGPAPAGAATEPRDHRPDGAKPASAVRPLPSPAAATEAAAPVLVGKEASKASQPVPAAKVVPPLAQSPTPTLAKAAAVGPAVAQDPKAVVSAPSTLASEPAQGLERAVHAATARAVEPPLAALSATVSAPRAMAQLDSTVQAATEGAHRANAGMLAIGETSGHAMTDRAATTARGFAELNGKVLDLYRAQSDAAFALWRATLAARSLPEAFRAQTRGLTHLYETSAAQWKDVAETAARLMGEAAKPLPSAWPDSRA